MNIKDEVFLSTMFQVNVKTNFNIEYLPSLSCLIYQAAQLSQDKQLSRPQFVQIGTKYCGLKQEDSLLMFELFSSLYKAESAPPRVFIAFLFCCLFKSTVSSKRSKILADDLWPQQQQTFEAMVEQYVKTCSDILAASMCIKNSNQSAQSLQQLRIDQEGLTGLNFLLQSVPDNLKGKTALEVSTQITHNCFCNNLPQNVIEAFQDKQIHFHNIKDKCLIYRFKQNVPTVKIYNCQHAVIFLLGPTANVIISNCHNVKIIVTSCIGLVTLNSSKTINLSAICKFCKIYHTDDLQLNVNCFYGCLQDSQAQTVSQAPFNWIYENLDADLQQVGLQNLLSCYVNIRIVGALGLEWTEKVSAASDFCTQIVPVGQISGKKLLVQLPEQFQAFVEKRVQRLKEFQTKLDSMNSDEKIQFETEMKQQLLGWLQANNMANEMGWISSAEIKDL